jgi:hypothetical protein
MSRLSVLILYRDITEKLPYPRSSIQDNSLNGLFLLLKGNSPLPPYVNGFVLYFLHIEILLQMR